MAKEIRSFDYVNHPYETVRDALRGDATTVFRAATQAAASRSQNVAAALHVDIAGIRVAKDIEIAVNNIEESDSGVQSDRRTRLVIEWAASNSPGMFPLMKAELAVYPLTATETQLDFSGNYEPPLGWLGSAVDAVVGYKIAEASVHRFVAQVAAYLRTTLGNAG
jgi:hypothetical protein